MIDDKTIHLQIKNKIFDDRESKLVRNFWLNHLRCVGMVDDGIGWPRKAKSIVKGNFNILGTSYKVA